MSKTTPVRWWRDDADRYRSRGPQQVPAATPDPAWMIELLAPHDPSMTRQLEEWMGAVVGPEALARAFALPAEMLESPYQPAWKESARRMLEGTVDNDPVADVRAAIES